MNHAFTFNIWDTKLFKKGEQAHKKQSFFHEMS